MHRHDIPPAAALVKELAHDVGLRDRDMRSSRLVDEPDAERAEGGPELGAISSSDDRCGLALLEVERIAEVLPIY